MHHRSSRLRLNQKPDHARSMQRNLVTSLVLYEALRTTRKRARVIQPIFDRLITTAKTKDAYNAIRQINTVVTDKNASRKIMEVLLKRYSKRSSGYTKVVPVGARKGDGAQLVDLFLLDRPETQAALSAEKPAKAEKKTATKKAPKKAEKADTSSESVDSPKQS